MFGDKEYSKYKEKELEDSDEEKIKELLMFHKIIEVNTNNDSITLDNGIILEFEGNRGCGGCSSGWYSVTELNGCDNVITNVIFNEDVPPIDKDDDDETYTIFVFAEDKKIKLLQVDGTYGNGCYGSGYTIKVKTPIIEQIPIKVDVVKSKPFQLNENQARVISFIESTLGIAYNGTTSKEYFDFIRDNRAKANIAYKNQVLPKDQDTEDMER